jgi:hypothetical protein
VFLTLNGGVLLLALGFVENAVHIARLGAAMIALAGLVYSAVTLWTLSFAFRDSVPWAAQKNDLANPARMSPGFGLPRTRTTKDGP